MADPLGGEEDLLPSIRQLISSIKSTLRAASNMAAAEEMVLHLEETDENFHRFVFFCFMYVFVHCIMNNVQKFGDLPGIIPVFKKKLQ